MPRTVALTTLGCARNEVDSEELAGRLAADGWQLTGDASSADVVLVNTCGFIEAAKKDSIDTLLEAADLKRDGRAQAVVAVGCLAERYGKDLATALPEADAVLGFDDYPEISVRLRSIVAGERPTAHHPRDRRRLLPLTPVARHDAAVTVPGFASTARSHDPAIAPPYLSRIMRRRLGDGPVAPLKIASGCDRRCSFCAIPSFRGAFVSRPPADVLAEARWLSAQGVRELVLVSENSTSYGKDLGDLRLLERLLPELATVPGIDWVRVSYLQPAELRPGLIDVMTSTPGVLPYFDLSFQHASPAVLRRMRRFGDTDRFLDLLAAVRDRWPEAGARSNVIVGFPGETDEDVAELERFLTQARLDAIGVFAYSDEEGTAAASLPEKVDDDTIRARTEQIAALAEELTAQRADERIGEVVEVLIESATECVEGRAGHQAPEVDGSTVLTAAGGLSFSVGDLVEARVVDSMGADLIAEPVTDPPRLGARR